MKDMKTTKLYVDWLDKEILTEEEIEDLIQELVEDSIARDADYMTFEEFLAGYYSHTEIFHFTEIEKKDALFEYEEGWKQIAEKIITQKYDVVEIDL